MALKTRVFDPADFLDDDETIAAYLDEAMATGDRKFIAQSIGVVARARRMTQIAKDTGLLRARLVSRTMRRRQPRVVDAVRGDIRTRLAAARVDEGGGDMPTIDPTVGTC